MVQYTFNGKKLTFARLLFINCLAVMHFLWTQNFGSFKYRIKHLFEVAALTLINFAAHKHEL